MSMSDMLALRAAIRQMIDAGDDELDVLCSMCQVRILSKNQILHPAGKVPEEVYFITQGMLRVTATDIHGDIHTLHFASENQFIADYSCFIKQIPALYALQALEPLQVVVMPRAAIDWGYSQMKQGNKLGRLIAEYYFIYQDQRIHNLYYRTPQQRYASITQLFPDIHQRVPQHMIASYLGITPVHLSRLKKQAIDKV